MSSPRVLVNAGGQSFADEIPELAGRMQRVRTVGRGRTTRCLRHLIEGPPLIRAGRRGGLRGRYAAWQDALGKWELGSPDSIGMEDCRRHGGAARGVGGGAVWRVS